MATAVQVPQFGNTVEECVVSRWFTRKGSAVSAGEIIAEIETDKTTFEINAPVAGVVLEMFFEEGALAPVFANLCVIGEAGESVESFRKAAVPESAEPAKAVEPVESEEPEEPARRAKWSPRARRLAEQQLTLQSIAGSGPNGRVLEQDVRRAARPGNTRQIIARRLRESLATTAQYTLHGSANASGLLAVRERAKASATLANININHLVAHCTVHALRAEPNVNVEFIDGQIVRHAEVHLGFACDTPKGLLVPVVRDADTLAVADLARRITALASAATSGTISPADLAGATFTISNLGGLGVEFFTPVLNPPQVAILGVGAIQLKPVRVNDRVEFVDTIALSLTLDHQVIDGAPGARFLKVLKEKIEAVTDLVPHA